MESLENLKNQIFELEYDIQRIDEKILSTTEKKWSKTKSITHFVISLIGVVIGGLFIFLGSILVFGLILLISFSFYLIGSLYLQSLFKKTIKQLNVRKSNKSKKIIELKKVKSQLIREQDEYVEKSIIELKLELDTDGDNTIDVIQHDNEFMKILKSNQEVILEMEKSENRDFTKQFVKLSNFLEEKEKNLQRVFSRIGEITERDYFDTFKSNLIEQIQFYNVLRLNSLQMISSFVDDDRITFYMVYEKFDKLGVWNTNFENQFLFKMDLLNSNIERLISEIRDMSDSINYSINELISITEENTFSLSDKLGEIGSKLDVSNLLNTINTYQNYKTNKRLR